MNRTMTWSRPLLGLSVVLLVSLAFAGTALARDEAGADARRLGVQLLDLNRYSGTARDQAFAINTELRALERVLPGIEVVTDRDEVEDSDYSLSNPRLKLQGDHVSLTVHYRGPEAVEDEPTGWYWESCAKEDEQDGDCTKATVEERAPILVADLLNQTLAHWRNGVFGPFVVLSCERQSLRLIRLTLSPPTVVETYSEPASWFEYRPSRFETGARDPHPESLDLVLGRRTKEGEVFVFERRYDPGHRFEALCDTEGRWILEHQYPGSYLYRPPAARTPPGINAAPPREEP